MTAYSDKLGPILQLITCRDLHFHYAQQHVLQGIQLTVQPGEMIILTGPSGSGKTTLLTLMGGLRTGATGEMKILEHTMTPAPSRKNMASIRQKIGFIFQYHNLLTCLTAQENVLLGLGPSRNDTQNTSAKASQVLQELDMQAYAHHKPSQLSGGQQQRIAVARALIHNPQLILADEPTASLDTPNALRVMQVLRQHTRLRPCACILITHDHRLHPYADRILTLQEGRVLTDLSPR